MKVFAVVAVLSALAASSAHAQCAPDKPMAFTNVRVLSMRSPALSVPGIVMVRNGRITHTNAVATDGACVIDGRGGVLMPALADMHVHTNERELSLYLANGVTLVREMNGTPAMVALRERIKRGELVGPRLLVASPLLVGTPLQFRHRLITSVDDAFKAAHEAKDAGYDYLKIYDGLSKAMYEAFVEASRTLGIPLDGHVPADVGIQRVLDAGQSIQHMDKIAFAIAGHSGDTTKLAEVRRLFANKRVWVTPTIASLHALDMARTVDYAARLARSEMAYVDSGSMGWWRSLSGDRPSRPLSGFYQFQIATLQTLKQLGTPLLLGTDAANPLMVAGFSVHDELDALVHDAKFTPYDALLLATRNVGEFLRDSTIGRIDVGARADLILVNGDPTADLTTLRTPVGVMVAGRWLNRSSLDSMLTRARQR